MTNNNDIDINNFQRVTGEQVRDIVIGSECAAESETVIQFDRRGDGTAHIYTSDNTVLTTLKKRLKDNPQDWKVVKYDTYICGGKTKISGVWIECPKSYISYLTKKPSKKSEKDSDQN